MGPVSPEREARLRALASKPLAQANVKLPVRPKSASTFGGRRESTAYAGQYADSNFAAAQAARAAIDARRRLALQTPTDRFAAARAVRALTPHIQRADVTIPVPIKVRLSFEAFDRNRSGNLDYRELKNALRHYGFDVSSREAVRVLSAYDDTPSGKVRAECFPFA